MALSTVELDEVLTNNNVTKNTFIGTYPSCMLPSTKKKIYSFITNTDDHSSSGTHWNAWFVNNNELTFFDTFGRSYNNTDFPKFYGEIAKKYKKVKYSKIKLQSRDSYTCGYFCVYFIYSLCLGIEFKYFLSDFTKNLECNDYIVLRFVDSIC